MPALHVQLQSHIFDRRKSELHSPCICHAPSLFAGADESLAVFCAAGILILLCYITGLCMDLHVKCKADVCLQGQLIALFTSDAQVIAQATAVLPLVAFAMVSNPFWLILLLHNMQSCSLFNFAKGGTA